MSIAGRRYLERGAPVTVLAGWGPGGGDRAVTARVFAGARRVPRFGPRNVLVERADGSRAVRPFRGLRRMEVGRGERVEAGRG